MMFHRSERLFLRPAWPEDREAIFQGIADEGVVRNLARAPWPYEPDHARDWAKIPQDPANPRFMITLPESRSLVGCIGLDRREGVMEMGYWIARAHWGKGYASEAGSAVLDIAQMLGHDRLQASHFVDNPASGRVLRKIGFRPTGMTMKHNCLARGHAVEAVGYEIDLGRQTDHPRRAA